MSLRYQIFWLCMAILVVGQYAYDQFHYPYKQLIEQMREKPPFHISGLEGSGCRWDQWNEKEFLVLDDFLAERDELVPRLIEDIDLDEFDNASLRSADIILWLAVTSRDKSELSPIGSRCRIQNSTNTREAILAWKQWKQDGMTMTKDGDGKLLPVMPNYPDIDQVFSKCNDTQGKYISSTSSDSMTQDSCAEN
ncbi:MAG: hypothetical protein KDA65_04380 [Planctomycetaceae bacterium]|nr:hypothetical protein [Planctomycetaceae bacterium]